MSKPAPKTKSLTILHLYPGELNIYGDRGNILTLVQRLAWRGYGAKVIRSTVGGQVDIGRADLIFGGGGQDRGQVAVGEDLQRHGVDLQRAADDGVPMLTICGTYQLFGSGFTTLEGQTIPGIGIFKAHTMGSTERMIGNVVVDTSFGQLVGFENHSGRTLLEADQQPLGVVKKGFGNDGRSGMEGAVYNSVYGTYLHGPVLPKNPHFADALLLAALRRKYGLTDIEPLDDALEQQAARDASRRPQ